ncbi:hypothetical protein HYALB_00001369, partial [Hymenoscyphus albidus]
MSEQKCPVCPTQCREQSLYDPSNFTNTHSPVIFTPDPSKEPTLPSLLLLSLSHNDLQEPLPSDTALFEKFKTVSNTYRATTLDDAVDYLETHKPIAILVTDAGITCPENDYLVDHLKSYVFHGGRVIFALSFPRFFASSSPSSSEDSFNYFFASKWGLPWRLGECIRQEYEFASWCVLPEGLEKEKLEGIGWMVADVLGVRGAGVEEFLFTPALRGE